MFDHGEMLILSGEAVNPCFSPIGDLFFYRHTAHGFGFQAVDRTRLVPLLQSLDKCRIDIP